MDQLHIPAGESGEAPFDAVVDPGELDEWTYTGFRVLSLEPGGSARVDSGSTELMIVPLSGACDVSVDDRDGHHDFALAGRPDVFVSATDVAYVGTGSSVQIASAGGGRFAIASALATAFHAAAKIDADDIPVEIRGGGDMTRKVRNFGTVGSFDDCDSIIACEVITPGGNWSSYPAHKHDETIDDPDHPESELEEIYYYEIQDGPEGTPGFGYHQTSSTDPDRPIDTLVQVRSGDVVLVPHGWHGPCAAAPGHDMYYLNVMAGPDEHRAWNITDHPDQTWVRGTWDAAGPDPRLADEN